MLPKLRQGLPARIQARARRAREAPTCLESRSPARPHLAGGHPWVKSPGSWNTRASSRAPPRRRARINDWFEIYQPFPDEKLRTQGARCMDCGVPFCHTGCPLTNIIPDWNDLVYRGRWKEASASCTPPTTSRSSPAASARRPARPPACWASTSRRSPSSRSRRAIVDRAFAEGWIKPEFPARAPASAWPSSARAPRAWPPRSNWRAPATTSRLREERPHRRPAALRHPDFKMEKHLIDRRLEQMRAEGVKFRNQRPRGRQRPVETCAASSTPSCWPAAPSSRAISRCPAAS
jgi:glutamate synthase (NADPH/NADH) small chain